MDSTRSPLVALFKKDHSRSRLDELCDFPPVEGPEENVVFWFSELVAWLRPRAGQGVAAKVRFLEHRLEARPETREGVSIALSRLVKMVEMERLLGYGGIPANFHFGAAVKDWILAALLPPACRTHDGSEIMRLSFERADVRWLGAPEVSALFRRLLDDESRALLERALRAVLLELAHQIVAQAHAPAVRSLARLERSPFRGLYSAVEALDVAPDDPATLPALLGRIKQCALSLSAHRAEHVERGANLNTTFQLARLEQQLARLALLSRLRHTTSDELVAEVSAAILKTVLQAVNGARLFRQSSDLLVQNLVDTAANVGRAYIDEDRSTWRTAFLAGAGGGVLMAIATLVKFFLMGLHLPTIYEGLAYSLNYGSAFCGAYLMHYTIATKLPAQTAAALARSVQAGGGHGERLRVFGDVWRRVLRVMIAGLIGNVVVVGPLCFLTDVVATHFLGRHLLTAHTAHHVLTSNSALSLSAVYAALTGLFLWMSSLIGASGDNWARLTRLDDRLATNRAAMKRLNPVRARSFAGAIAGRAGGLLGNASLGFMLGAVPAIFAIFSLPVEIRHVTVSTGSVALAVARGDAAPADVAWAWLGVLVIAAVNCAVSFLLALGLALRATRGMRVSTSANALVWIGLRRHTFGGAASGLRSKVERDAKRPPLADAIGEGAH